MNIKKNGSYYTPVEITNFIVEYLLTKLGSKTKMDILEPSCGDGQFIKSFIDKKFFKNAKSKLYLIEKNKIELQKATSLLSKIKKNQVIVHAKSMDYLNFYFENKQKFDIVIGNPPYIHKYRLTSKQIKLSNKILDNNNLINSNVENIWIPFLIGSINMLKQNGILAMVLPAEILQVNYSEKIRKLLIDKFDLLEIFTFDTLIFPNIQQNIIILIGTKISLTKGIKIFDINDPKKLAVNNLTSVHYNIPDNINKWTRYQLNPKELNLIETIQSKIKNVNYYSSSGAGIVTGANDFFIVNKKIRNQYNLAKFVKTMIRKSSFITLGNTINKKIFNKYVKQNIPCYLLDFNNICFSKLPKQVKKYLRTGIKEGIHKRFKCKNRHPWYQVPSIWASEGFFFKRIHNFPKICFNPSKIYLSDSAYRIKVIKGYDIKNFIFSFYNSLTLLYLELYGRSYGGGVLELTPNEFKKLPLPYTSISNKEFNRQNTLLQNPKTYMKALKFSDNIILGKGLKLSKNKIDKLAKIREKLFKRRLKK